MLTSGDSGLLLQISGLSVAFAGFAGVAGVFRDHADRSDIKVEAGRLINMLVASLSTAILSLIPLIPDAFRVSDEMTWRISGFLALLTCIAFLPGIVVRTRRMARYDGFSVQVSLLIFCILSITAVAFLCCAFGLPKTNPGASYLCGLITLLLTCSIVFFRVIVSLLRPHAPD